MNMNDMEVIKKYMDSMTKEEQIRLMLTLQGFKDVREKNTK